MTAMSLLTDSVFIGVFWDDYRALRGNYISLPCLSSV